MEQDRRLTPGRPAPSTATRALSDHDPILAQVKDQCLAFDLESRGNDVQWTDAPGTHVQLGSFVVNGGPSQLTTGGPALCVGPKHTLLDLLLVAGTLTGHGIMNYDLIVLARQYPGFPTPWELTQSHRLWDTQLVESLLDPPEARLKEGEAQKHYKLEAVAQRRGFFQGKTLDLAERAKRYKHDALKKDPSYAGSGFELIPWTDDKQNIDLLEYARQDSRLVWWLVKDQLERRQAQPPIKRVETPRKLVPVPGKPDHFRYETLHKTIRVPKLTIAYIEREHRVAALAAQIQLNGFRIDTELLRERIEQGEQKKSDILDTLKTKYGLPTMTADGKKEAKSPQSTKAGKAAIRNAFLDTGLDPDLLPIKAKSKDPDLSKETMQAIIDDGENEAAAALAEAVLGLNGVRSIYTQIQDSLVQDRVHPNISFRQASGRWSFTRPGLTVVGKRKGRVIEREVFIAEPGHVIVTADLSQVDARAVAAMCQDENYMALFGEGRDPWTEMAELFGIDRDQVKVIGHGANYGMGVAGTKRHNSNIPIEAIEAFHRGRKEQFPKLMAWQDRVRWMAEQRVLLDNGWGRLLRVDPDRAYTQAPALSGQSAARDIMMQGLLNLGDSRSDTLPMLRAVVHDEAVLSVPEERAEDVAYAVNKAMTFPWAPHWGGVPIQIKAEASVGGRTWASAYGK